MKAVFTLIFAVALFASTASAQTAEKETTFGDEPELTLEEEGGDSLATETESSGLEAERTTSRRCTTQEFVTASFHCDDKHAPTWMNCRLTSCIVRGNYIVYTWSGYYFGV